MKKKDLEKLAQLGSVSVSTVSKAIRHCPGVNDTTRQHILKLAEEQQLYPEDGAQQSLRVILPDNPKYYWMDLYRGLRDVSTAAAPGQCRFEVYARMSETQGVLRRYLQQIPLEETSLLIAAASGQAAVVQRLRQLAGQLPVFLLTEYLDVPGAIFFGADACGDAERLGHYFACAHPERRRILCLTLPEAATHRQRVKGFFAAAGTAPRILPLPQQEPLAAQIARLLYQAWQSTPFDAVYCTDGQLPFVCRSVLKAGLGGRVICVGHENPQTNAPFFESGLLAATVEQDGYAQGRLAMQCAVQYLQQRTLPTQAVQTVPSRLYGAGGRLLEQT